MAIERTYPVRRFAGSTPEDEAIVAVEVKLPKLAASMDDGVISKWLKAVGDSVKRGEPLLKLRVTK